MINTLRSSEVFDANLYHDKKIVIVGMGAIGSRLLEALVSTGLENITGIDYDHVEDHNLGNQLFVRSQIGMSKVEACADWVEAKCGEDIRGKMRFINGKVDDHSVGWFEDAAVVICCVDSFSARQVVQEMATMAMVDLFIEASMATGHTTSFMLNPMLPSDVRQWRTTLGNDNDPGYEVSACGSGLSVGVTATLAGNVMAWGLMNWLKTGYIEKKLRLDTAPFQINRIDQR